MLDSSIKTQLKAYLEKLVQPIELVASLDDSATAQEMRSLLADIAELSDKVSLREDGQAARRPSFGIARAGQNPRIHFAGIPMGHEFTSLVLALLQSGGHPPKGEAEAVEQIKGLDGKFSFETFISLSCHNCPDVVQALNTMAVLNPNVEAVMIDGGVLWTSAGINWESFNTGLPKDGRIPISSAWPLLPLLEALAVFGMRFFTRVDALIYVSGYLS